MNECSVLWHTNDDLAMESQNTTSIRYVSQVDILDQTRANIKTSHIQITY